MGPVGIRSPNGTRARRYLDRSLPVTQRDLDLVLPKFDTSGGIDECHLYSGALDKDGYGIVKINGIWPPYKGAYRYFKAHQFIYLHYHPDLDWNIPTGLQLDHTCHSEAVKLGLCDIDQVCLHRRCGNLTHLELVTPLVNTRRGLSGKWQAIKTHCGKCGMAYDEKNTAYHIDKLGHVRRRCRNCHKNLEQQRRINRKLVLN